MRNRIKAMSGATKVLAGVVAGLLAGGAVVYAHTGDTGKVHACVDLNANPVNPNVHISGGPSDSGFAGSANAGCAVGQTAIDWSAAGTVGPQGPPGPQGPQGPQGPGGPQGTTGAAGTNGAAGTEGTSGTSKSGKISTVRRQIGPNKALTKTGRATCPKGRHVVAGGYNLPGNIPAVNIKESRPSGTTGWYGRGFRARGNGAWTLVLYAVCST